MTTPIFFSDPNDPQAREALQEAFEQQEAIPQTGLILKVQVDAEGGERLVNWQVADAKLIQAVILGLAVSAAAPLPKLS